MKDGAGKRRSRLRRLLSWPLRAYRTRISAQLITSSCLVVVVTVILVEVTVLTIWIWQTNPDEQLLISEDLGRQAVYVAGELAQSQNAPALAGETVPEADRTALQDRLTNYLETGVPLDADEPPASLGEAPRAAIISERGDIVASTSPEWAPPGRPYTSIDFAPTRMIVGRAFELRGADTEHENSYVLDYLDETLAAAQPIMVDEEFAGVLLFQADGVVDARQPLFRDFLFWVTVGNVALFIILAVPVLLIAVPVGIFRARRISRRLERLSDVTTTMARGDLTRRVDIEGEDEVARVGRRFNAMMTQLEQADRSRKAFVSNVSHELRTPVAILQGNLEQLIAQHQRPNDGTIEARTLEAMHQETVTLARLIDDLFTLARIEEETIEFEAAQVDLATCVRRTVDGIASLAWEQRRIKVESLVEDGLPPALGEQARIQQILSNLLYNALRHTPEGGVIVVDAEAAGDEVAVTVSDTGLGIPSDELPHVFDRYRQVERAERHTDGSGLGLAIVKQLVEAMDGHITVESAPNQGTTFRFTLPVAMRVG